MGTSVTRTQREQIRWFQSRLRTTADDLTREAQRTRCQQLAQLSPGWSVMWIVAAIVYGPLVAAFISGVYSGRRGLALVADAAVVLLIVAVGVASLELTYRYQRWKSLRLATEAEAQAGELDQLLPKQGMAGVTLADPS